MTELRGCTLPAPYAPSVLRNTPPAHAFPPFTAQTQPAAFGGPPRRGWYGLTRASQSQIGVLVVVFLVLLVFLAVAVAVGVSVNSGSGNHSHRASSSGASALPSTTDDWERAVCRPGTFFDGRGHLPNAVAQAECVSQKNVPIMIGQYTSSFALENDVAILKRASYASTVDPTGETTVFIAPVPGERSASALSPLTQFGFQVETVPAYQ
jgi:hypothetical protein